MHLGPGPRGRIRTVRFASQLRVLRFPLQAAASPLRSSSPRPTNLQKHARTHRRGSDPVLPFPAAHASGTPPAQARPPQRFKPIIRQDEDASMIRLEVVNLLLEDGGPQLLAEKFDCVEGRRAGRRSWRLEEWMVGRETVVVPQLSSTVMDG